MAIIATFVNSQHKKQDKKIIVKWALVNAPDIYQPDFYGGCQKPKIRARLGQAFVKLPQAEWLKYILVMGF